MTSYQEKKLPSTITVPSSSSYLNIDTRDQLKYDADGYIENTYQNPFDISIYKPDSIFQGRVLRMALTNFNMLWSCPNVNPYNNILYLEREDPANPGQVIESHTLELGVVAPSTDVSVNFFTPPGLALAITTALNTAAVFTKTNWICSSSLPLLPASATDQFNSGVGFTISTVDASVSFRVNPRLGKDKGTYTNPTNNVIYTRTSTLADIMGFTNASKVFAPAQISDTPSMIYTRYIDVVSDELTGYQYTRDASSSKTTGRNLVARIFLNKNEGINPLIQNQTTGSTVGTQNTYNQNNYLGMRPFTINYEPKSVKYMKWDSGAFLSGLNIRILDEFGNLLFDDAPATAAVNVLVPGSSTGTTGAYAGSASYCQMTFTVTEGDN